MKTPYFRPFYKIAANNLMFTFKNIERTFCKKYQSRFRKARFHVTVAFHRPTSRRGSRSSCRGSFAPLSRRRIRSSLTCRDSRMPLSRRGSQSPLTCRGTLFHFLVVVANCRYLVAVANRRYLVAVASCIQPKQTVQIIKSNEYLTSFLENPTYL